MSEAHAEIESQTPREFEPLVALLLRWRLLVFGPLVLGCIALGISYLVTPTFTARASFLPPQQQGSAGSALASLGNLAGLAGVAGGGRTPVEQYVALLQSRTLQDRIIDRFDLLKSYDEKLRVDALRELANRLRINLGKREGVIAVEVDDESPQRAADMANGFVDELRKLTATLAVTEAQQRRVFFENELKATRDRLAKAQKTLQDSGFDQAALRAEPRASAEAYARLKAEVTAAEARLSGLRSSLSDSTPEVTQQAAAVSSLKLLTQRYEKASPEASADYISRYRDFKYQEALFEVYSRQFELARVDEAKEGAFIQQIDVAQAPERKSKPKRSWVAIGATLGSAMVLALWVLGRAALVHWRGDPLKAAQLEKLRLAVRGNGT